MTSTQALDLIARVKECTYSGDRRFTSYLGFDHELKPPMTEEEMQSAEAELGFSLPPLIRGLYLEVGGAEFGPGYGFQGLLTGQDAVIPHLKRLLGYSTPENLNLWAKMRKQEPRDWGPAGIPLWPEKLLPLIYLGCELYACIDCADEGLQMWGLDKTRFGYEPDNPLQIFRSEDTLPSALEKWMAGVDPFK